MSPGRVLAGLPVAVVLLAGCGADPADERRQEVAALTEAANDGDASQVRDRADALLATVSAQRERGQISDGEAGRLTALAQSVRSSADVIDADLLERRRVEAEAEAARRQLEQARKQLEEERRKAEEAAREAAEEAAKRDEGKGDDDGKGKGKGDDKDDDKDDD